MIAQKHAALSSKLTPGAIIMIIYKREIEEEELDTGPGRNAEELLRSKKRLAAGVYDTCH